MCAIPNKHVFTNIQQTRVHEHTHVCEHGLRDSLKCAALIYTYQAVIVNVEFDLEILRANFVCFRRMLLSGLSTVSNTTSTAWEHIVVHPDPHAAAIVGGIVQMNGACGST